MDTAPQRLKVMESLEAPSPAKPPITRQGYPKFQRKLSRREVYEGDK